MTIMTAPPTAANPSRNATPGRYAGVDTHRDTHHVAVVDDPLGFGRQGAALQPGDQPPQQGLS